MNHGQDCVHVPVIQVADIVPGMASTAQLQNRPQWQRAEPKILAACSITLDFACGGFSPDAISACRKSVSTLVTDFAITA